MTMLRRLAPMLLAIPACVGPAGPAAEPCSVVDNGDGTPIVTCPDGSTAVLGDAEGETGEGEGEGEGDIDVGEGEGDAGEGEGEGEGEGDPAMCEGSFNIRNSIDRDNLSGCREITGNLDINAPGLTSLRGLEGLERVRGRIFIVTTDLADLQGLDTLREVGELSVSGLFGSTGPHLQSLAGLESLESVDAIELNNLPELTSLAPLTRLTNVNRLLIISFLPSLETLDGLENLAVAEEVQLNFLVTLRDGTAIHAAVNNLSISNSPALAALGPLQQGQDMRRVAFLNVGLPNLGGLAGFAPREQLALEAMPALTSTTPLGRPTRLSLAVIADNPLLTDVDALAGLVELVPNPALVETPFVHVDRNVRLPQCAVDEALAALAQTTAAISSSGNDDAATCD